VRISEAMTPIYERLSAPVRPLVLRWSAIDRDLRLLRSVLQYGRPPA